jgi:hypothetical protein
LPKPGVRFFSVPHEHNGLDIIAAMRHIFT